MALTGTLLADFSSFTAECAKAEQSLQGFEQGAGKVEVALDGVAAANDRVTASTQKGAEVIDIFGKRRDSIAQQVAEMPALLAAESAAWETVTISEFEADKALSAMAVAQRNAAAASVETESAIAELGLVGFGGLVIAMGYSIDQFIQWGVKVTDADNKIQHLAESIMGWGISAQETAELVDITGQRTIRLYALLNSANHDLSESEREVKKAILEKIDARIQEEAEDRKWIDQSMKIAHDSVVAEQKAAEERAKAEQDNINVLHDLWNERVAQERRVTEAITKETNERIIQEFKEQQAEKAVLDEFNKSLEIIPQVGHAADDLGGSIDVLAGKTFAFAAGLGATNRELSDFYDIASRGAGVGIGDPTSGSGAIGTPVGGGARVPHFDTGGPVMRDGLIYAHAGEFVLPKGAGGGGTVIQNTFHIVDTESNIVSRVSAAITRSLMQSTKMGAA